MAAKWLTVAEVPPDSGVGRQLQAMRDYLAGRTGAGAFVERWLDGRRAQMRAGEPYGARIGDVLDDLFFAVDAYDPSTTDRDPDWLDADQLRDAVRRALDALDRLRAGGRG